MPFSNDLRYFCGGRLFTIFSFSHCLACLIWPGGYFAALIAKARITRLCFCWRWGSNPQKKSLPQFHTYPAHSLSLLVSSRTSNLLLTMWSWFGNCRALPSVRGAGRSDQHWSFPVDCSLPWTHLLTQWRKAAITRSVTCAVFFEKSWKDSHKILLVAILAGNPGNSIVKSGSVLEMGTDQRILIIKVFT